MNSRDIIDVTDADFEYEVVNYSMNIPVVVDYWAEWCKPCKALEPVLQKLVQESSGGFRLARVDVDQNPNIVLRYSIHSIPTVKAFSQGEVVGEFSGMQTEQRIRDFLSRIVPPSPLTLAIEKGDSLMEFHDWSNAEKTYREILEKSPEHPAAMLGLAKVYLATAQPHNAYLILNDFPESRQFAHAETLKPLSNALLDFEKGALPEESDLDTFFANSMRLVYRQNYQAALDGLLEIIKENRSYRGGLARTVFLGILELLGENDATTRRYRSELASLLF